MTRYSLFITTTEAPLYLAASYEPDHSGIVFTPLQGDACEYVSIDKATDVARQLKKLHGYDIYIAMKDSE